MIDELLKWVGLVGLVIVIVGALVTYVIMALKCFSLEHNIPDLWERYDKLMDRVNILEKKVTTQQPVAVSATTDRREATDGKRRGKEGA